MEETTGERARGGGNAVPEEVAPTAEDKNAQPQETHSDLALWRVGKGPCPYNDARMFTQDDLIRALNELEEDPEEKEERRAELGLLLDAIDRLHVRYQMADIEKALPAMRAKFYECKGTLYKLELAAWLVHLGDFTGVAFARDVFETGSQGRNLRAMRILQYVWTDDELRAMLGRFSNNKVVSDALTFNVRDRELERRRYNHELLELGCALEELSDYALLQMLRRPTSLHNQIILELYQRQKEKK